MVHLIQATLDTTGTIDLFDATNVEARAGVPLSLTTDTFVLVSGGLGARPFLWK